MALFTTANAREMGLRSVAARKAASMRHSNSGLLTAPLNDPQTVPLSRWSNAPGQSSAEPDYALVRLTRVREQLDRIDSLISKETNPQNLERLARASTQLCDQEFALAGRPKPGNRRPAVEQTRPLLPPMPIPPTLAKPAIQPPLPKPLPAQDLTDETEDGPVPLEPVPFEPPPHSPPPTKPERLPVIPRLPASALASRQINNSPLIQHTPPSPRMTWKDGNLGYHSKA